MEIKMRLHGFKLKERVNRVINKLFDKEIDLSDVFARRPTGGTGGGDSEGDSENDHRPSQSKIIKRTMAPVDEMCKFCEDITKMEEPQPLLDQVKLSGDEAEAEDDAAIYKSKRFRALHETRKWIFRQHAILR